MKVGMIGARSTASITADTIREVGCTQNYTVAARGYGRATEFAQKHGSGKACGSYEELVGDAGVELVYIAALHSRHYEHIKLCPNHGKRILYEESFIANRSQAREVPELTREKKPLLTEAIWTRYTSTRRTLDDVLLNSVIGRPYMLTTNLDYIISREKRTMCPELTEGALLGVGICPLNFALIVFGNEVDTITGTAVTAETGVDAQSSVTVIYKDGRVAALRNGTTELSDHRGIIYSDNGFIEVENISSCEGIRIYDRSENMIVSYNTPRQTSGYEYRVEACLWAVEEGVLECPETPHGGTLRVMGRTDELRRQWGLVYPMEK